MLFRTWGRNQDIAIGLDRVFELLDREPEVFDAPDAAVLGPVLQGVVFKGVGFRYQPDRPALEEASFSARRGTITAIVGRSFAASGLHSIFVACCWSFRFGSQGTQLKERRRGAASGIRGAAGLTGNITR